MRFISPTNGFQHSQPHRNPQKTANPVDHLHSRTKYGLSIHKDLVSLLISNLVVTTVVEEVSLPCLRDRIHRQSLVMLMQWPNPCMVVLVQLIFMNPISKTNVAMLRWRP